MTIVPSTSSSSDALLEQIARPRISSIRVAAIQGVVPAVSGTDLGFSRRQKVFLRG
jgi:hypothetical protein